MRHFVRSHSNFVNVRMNFFLVWIPFVSVANTDYSLYIQIQFANNFKPFSWNKYTIWWKIFQIQNNHTYRSALRTPDQRAPVTGGMNRNEPIGGDAYGIPLNASTGSKCRPSKCTITPDNEPYFVCTTRDDNCTVSAPMPPKLLILLLLLLAAAFDVLPLPGVVLSPLLLLITLFILLVPPLLLLLLPLLSPVEINRRNISIIIMNVFVVSCWFCCCCFCFCFVVILLFTKTSTKGHYRSYTQRSPNWFLFDFSLGSPFFRRSFFFK